MKLSPPPNYKKACQRLAKQLKLYVNYETHHNDLLEACRLAEKYSQDKDDKAYWSFQMRTLIEIRKEFNKNKELRNFVNCIE